MKSAVPTIAATFLSGGFSREVRDAASFISFSAGPFSTSDGAQCAIAHSLVASTEFAQADGAQCAIVHVIAAGTLSQADGVQCSIAHVIAAGTLSQADGVQCAIVHVLYAAIVAPTDGVMCSIVHDFGGRSRNVWRLPDKPSSTWRAN